MEAVEVADLGVEAALGVEAVLGALDRDACDADVVALLERTCSAFVAEDRIHRLAPHADRLRGLDFSAHPRAALPAGVAICTIDRPLGRAVLAAGRRHLETADDPEAGLAWFLEGLEDLGEGKLESASAWWRRALGLLDPVLPATRMILAHLALGAYEKGDLPEAITLAEEALWRAEAAGDGRTEALAALYLGFFHLYTGRFSNCDHLTERAEQAMLQVAKEDRYELPLVDIERGALAALRGDVLRSERCFERALDLARDDGNDWYLAIGLIIRADFTGKMHPTRAVADARAALDHLDPIGEGWWSRWARLALGAAHLHAGNYHAGHQTCAALLDLELNPLERGRTLLVMADLLHAAGDHHGSEDVANESLVLLADAQADFWAARARLALGRLSKGAGEAHRRRARLLAGAEAADPAWRRLLLGPGELRVNLLGDASVRVDGVSVPFSTKAEVELIAMLACADGPVRTWLIGDRLWPDDDPAKVAHRVDNLLCSVRRALQPTSRLRRERGMVELELDHDDCDLTGALRSAAELIANGRSADRSDDASRVVELLRRPLLGSLETPWTILEQERLNALADRVAAAAA